LGNCLIEEYFPPISRELSALARIRIYMWFVCNPKQYMNVNRVTSKE
jgi:hypothetical protein